MEHNDRLLAVHSSVNQVVSAILSTWERATASEREQGAQWYSEAEGLVDTWAAETGYSREHCAAVVAQLSPRTTWQRNIAGAYAMLTGMVPAHCMSANVARAEIALESDDPLSTINGPKTSRFARNILGDTQAVTVDVWAARVAFAGRTDSEALLGKAGIYEAVEFCYQVAAQTIGVAPTTMQAATWIVARNGRAQ